MAKWQLKAVVQKAISFLPYKTKINYLFQRYVTKGVALDDVHFGYKLEAARDHLHYYARYGSKPPAETTTLELGTGWYPIVPFCLFLAGFRSVVSVDLYPWLTAERMRTAARRVLDHHDRGFLKAYVPTVLPERLAVLRRAAAADLSVAAFARAVGLDYRVMDARRLDFAAGSFDFIVSNNTFEHVHADVLAAILTEFRRVLAPHGTMSHFIDLSDHFAHFDGSIGIYNFLRFSARRWRLIDNDIQPQNRLRWPDYLALYAAAGLPVRAEVLRPYDVAVLAEVPVHPEYAAYRPEDLAISHGSIIS